MRTMRDAVNTHASSVGTDGTRVSSAAATLGPWADTASATGTMSAAPMAQGGRANRPATSVSQRAASAGARCAAAAQAAARREGGGGGAADGTRSAAARRAIKGFCMRPGEGARSIMPSAAARSAYARS